MMSYNYNNPNLKSLDDLIDACAAGDYSIRDEILSLCRNDPKAVITYLEELTAKIAREDARIRANEIDNLNTPLLTILQDETPFDLPDILQFARERLGREIASYKTLKMMRLKLEIAVVMNSYVLSGTRETPFLQECIDKIYEFNPDITNLLRAGLNKPTQMYSINPKYLSNKASGNEALVNKSRIKDEINMAMKDRPDLQLDMGQLLNYFLEEEFIEQADMLDLVKVWEAIPEKMSLISTASLIKITIWCEKFLQMLNILYRVINRDNDRTVGKKLRDITYLQIITKKIELTINDITAMMAERLSWLNPEDLLRLKSAEHAKKFLNDIQLQKTDAYVNFLKNVVGYEFKNISVTEIIKFMLYISLRGTPEQKKEIYLSQPGNPGQPEIVRAFTEKLAEWKMPCSQGMKDCVIKLMLDDIIVSNLEFEALKQLLTLLKNDKNNELFNSFLLAFEKGLMRNKNAFIKLCQLMALTNEYDNASEILYRMIKCCDTAEDVVYIEKYYRDLAGHTNKDGLILLNEIIRLLPLNTVSGDLEYVIKTLTLFNDKDPLMLKVIQTVLVRFLVNDDEIVSGIREVVAFTKKFKPRALLNITECEDISSFTQFKEAVAEMEEKLSPLDKMVFNYFDRETYFDIMPDKLASMKDVIKLDQTKLVTDVADFNLKEVDNQLIAGIVEEECKGQNAERVKNLASDVAELIFELQTVMLKPSKDHLRSILYLIVGMKNQYPDQRMDEVIQDLFQRYSQLGDQAIFANQIIGELLKSLPLANEQNRDHYSGLIKATFEIVAGLDAANEFSNKQKMDIQANLVKSLRSIGEQQPQEAVADIIKPLLEVKSSFKMKERLCNFVSALLSIVGLFSKKAKQSSQLYSSRAGFFQGKIKHLDVMHTGLAKLRAG